MKKTNVLLIETTKKKTTFYTFKRLCIKSNLLIEVTVAYEQPNKNILTKIFAEL